MSLNKVTLIGHVGADVIINTLQSGTNTAKFKLATSEYWKDKGTGERREKTEWHQIVVFNERLVNVLKNYVKKGSKLYIEGSLQTRKWTDKNNVEKYITEIVLKDFSSSILLLSNNNQEDSNNNLHQNNNHISSFDASDIDDEMPF